MNGLEASRLVVNEKGLLRFKEFGESPFSTWTIVGLEVNEEDEGLRASQNPIVLCRKA